MASREDKTNGQHHPVEETDTSTSNGQDHPATPATDTKAPTDERINYYKAVAEAREILATIDSAERGYFRLGQLAHERVEAADYGDRTLAKFADDVGVAKCTLDRYATVYKAWKGILAPGPKTPSYSVLRELAPHADDPACKKAILDDPNITKREARDLKRRLKGVEEEKAKEAQETEWLKDIRRGLRELYDHAEEAYRAAEVWLNCTPEKQRELLQVAEGLQLMNLGLYGRTIAKFGDHFEAMTGAEQEAPETAAPEGNAYVAV
jgi:hypothetical protein